MTYNDSLCRASKAKNDEFFTRYEDIEKELRYYTDHFKDKIIYCNCDRLSSAFYLYFADNFKRLQLKGLIFSYYSIDGSSYVTEQDKQGVKVHKLEGNGDFRSAECLALLKRADIVVTNPPFSLLREFIPLMVSNKKDFLIIGNYLALTYIEIWPLFLNGAIQLGATFPKRFYEPDGSVKEICSCSWFTTLSHNAERQKLKLIESTATPKFYDNFNAVNVDSIRAIPSNYSGLMGVPLGVLKTDYGRYFELVGLLKEAVNSPEKGIYNGAPTLTFTRKGKARKRTNPAVEGRAKFSRVLIKRKAELEE